MAIRFGLIGTLFVTSVVVFAVPSSAAAPQVGRVPVPDGRYGSVQAPSSSGSDCVMDNPVCYAPEALVMLTVRNRRIVNPRVMLPVTCRNVDGTIQEVAFGPTSNNPDRNSPIPRSGSGSVAWVEDLDSSLIREATVTLIYSFRRNQRPLVSVLVRSSDAEVTCEGSRDFRLGDGSGIPSSIFDPPA